MDKQLRVSIAADHGGFLLKEELKRYLGANKYKVLDFGTTSAEPCDYPCYGYKAAEAVSKGEADYGIVICKTGFGMAIVANKMPGVRSAVCDTVEEAASARRHNECNVLALAATRVDTSTAKKITDKFLNTKPEGGRHSRRVNQIREMETRK